MCEKLKPLDENIFMLSIHTEWGVHIKVHHKMISWSTGREYENLYFYFYLKMKLSFTDI